MLRKNRAFRSFLIGRTIDLCGSAMTPIVLTLAVLDATSSVSDTGIVLAANMVPTLVFMLLGGVLADRFARARIVTVTCLASACTQMALAACLLSGQFSVLLMSILAALSGMISAFTNPALRGIVPDLVPEEDVHRANAMLAASKNMAKILGPVAGGIFVSLIGGGWALIVDAATFLIASAFFSRLPGVVSSRKKTQVWRDLGEGWLAFRRLRWVWTLSICYAVINLLMIGPWQVLGADVVTREYTAALWGLVLSVRAAGLLVASVVLVKVRLKKPLATGLVLGSLSGLPLIALGMSSRIEVLIALVFVSACGVTVAAVTYDSTLQTKVPRGELSRIASFDDLLSFATVPLSQVLVGPMAELCGTKTLLCACGISVIVMHGVPLLRPDVRRMP